MHYSTYLIFISIGIISITGYMKDCSAQVINSKQNGSITDLKTIHNINTTTTEYSKISTFNEESRTFGRIKKLQFALLPIMYKLGVMSTIIMVILFLSAKGVFIGTLLLVMNIAFFVAKLATLKHQSQPNQWPQPNYWPQPSYGSAAPVHVHIHSPEQIIQSPPAQYEPYGVYQQPPTSQSNYGKWK